MSLERASPHSSPTFYRVAPNVTEIKAKELMGAILTAQQVTALQIIERNPSLLLTKTHGSYRVNTSTPYQSEQIEFKCSPLQALYQIGDAALLKAVRPHIDDVELAAQQIKEIDEQRKAIPRFTINFDRILDAISRFYAQLPTLRDEAEEETNNILSSKRLNNPYERDKIYTQAYNRRFVDAAMRTFAPFKDEVLKRVKLAKCLELQVLIETANQYQEHHHNWVVRGVPGLPAEQIRAQMFLIHIYGFLQNLTPKWFAHKLKKGLLAYYSNINDDTLIDANLKFQFDDEGDFYQTTRRIGFIGGLLTPYKNGFHDLGNHYYVDVNGYPDIDPIDSKTINFPNLEMLSKFLQKQDREIQTFKESLKNTYQLCP